MSLVCSTRVFDDVGVTAGRGVGRVAGRGVGRWSGLRWCSMMCSHLLAEVWVVLLVVVGVDGVGFVGVCGWFINLSRVWSGVLAVVWVALMVACGRLLRIH